MKKLSAVLACMLVVALAVPVLAGDDYAGGLTYARYRFNHFTEDFGTGDTSEYFDDDLDTTFTFSKGEVELWWEFEWADSNMGGDKDSQSSYKDAMKGYGGKWTPESLADSEFFLQVGDLGTGFGKNVNNDDSPRGSIEVGFKGGAANFVIGYGRDYEGDTNDDNEGDTHLLRGQMSMPVGENFNIGAYLALYAGSDIILQAADADAGTVELKGDHSAFLGSFSMSGNAGGAGLFTEVGFAAGSRDMVAAGAVGDQDLSGFYLLGGADFEMDSVSFGIEAGFGTGDDPDTGDEDEGFLGFNNDFGFDDIIEDELAGGLSNKVYAKFSAGMSPSEKVDLSGALIYVAPVEDVAGVNGTVDSYGFEVDAEMNYKLADNLKYVLTGAFASLEEDWQGESSAFQIMNRLEFKF